MAGSASLDNVLFWAPEHQCSSRIRAQICVCITNAGLGLHVVRKARGADMDVSAGHLQLVQEVANRSKLAAMKGSKLRDAPQNVQFKRIERRA